MTDLDVGQLETALKALDGGPRDALERIDLLVQLAWALALAEPQISGKYNDEASELSAARDYVRGCALVKRNRCYLTLLTGNVTEALKTGLELVHELDEIQELEGKATVLDILFHVYERIGDFKSALEFNLQSLELNQSLGHRRGEAWALHNMGSMNTELEQFETALDYYEQALSIFKEIGYLVGESRVHSRVGLLMRAQGRHDEALAAQLLSRELSEQLKLRIGVALCDDYIGRDYEALGNTRLALKHYKMAVKAFEAQTNDSAAAEALVRLGRLEAKQGGLPVARGYLERAFEHLEGIGAKTSEMGAHEAMAELHELEGDPAQALHHTRRHHAIFEAVFDIEARSELKNLNIRMEMQRVAKDAEIYRLRYVELEGMQAQLLQAERMAALGGLAAGLAHEVNNPLGVIQSNLDLTQRATRVLESALPQAPRPKRTQAALDALRSGVKTSTEASDRIHHLVKSLGRFVRLDESAYIEADLVEGLQSALTLLAPSIPMGVQVIQRYSPMPKVPCYASEVNQAFMTLLRNAIDAVGNEGTIAVCAQITGAYARVEIKDTGHGMDEKQLDGIFELGFATRGQHVRFRLGLPTAAATIRKHGGTIEVSSQPGEGTQFVLRIPLASHQQGPV